MMLPAAVTFEYQPHYRGLLVDLRLEPNRNVPGKFDLIGTCAPGTTCVSRLFHASRSDDCAGRPMRLYGIEQRELDSGHVVRVAM
jgi:hypothetical protein